MLCWDNKSRFLSKQRKHHHTNRDTSHLFFFFFPRPISDGSYTFKSLHICFILELIHLKILFVFFTYILSHVNVLSSEGKPWFKAEWYAATFHMLSKFSLPKIIYYFYIEKVRLISSDIKFKNRLIFLKKGTPLLL